MKKKVKKNIGMDAKMPKDSCSSDKCPWHGTLKVRGRFFTGSIVSSRGTDTSIVKWDYYHYVPKYERYERRKTKLAAHNPSCIGAKIGDIVKIVECRPLSKSKKFVIIEKTGEEK